MFKWLYKYFMVSSAYHCNPLLDDHIWVKNKKGEFPTCEKCGRSCWWAFGYTTNAGTYLKPDYEAQGMMKNEVPSGYTIDSKP